MGGGTMKFTCHRYPSLVVMQGDKVGGRFKDGVLETTDQELIKILRQIPHVEEVKSKKAK
jgi:hypothetical protein